MVDDGSTDKGDARAAPTTVATQDGIFVAHAAMPSDDETRIYQGPRKADSNPACGDRRRLVAIGLAARASSDRTLVRQGGGVERHACPPNPTTSETVTAAAAKDHLGVGQNARGDDAGAA